MPTKKIKRYRRRGKTSKGWISKGGAAAENFNYRINSNAYRNLNNFNNNQRRRKKQRKDYALLDAVEKEIIFDYNVHGKNAPEGLNDRELADYRKKVDDLYHEKIKMSDENIERYILDPGGIYLKELLVKAIENEVILNYNVLGDTTKDNLVGRELASFKKDVLDLYQKKKDLSIKQIQNYFTHTNHRLELRKRLVEAIENDFFRKREFLKRDSTNYDEEYNQELIKKVNEMKHLPIGKIEQYIASSETKTKKEMENIDNN